MKELIADSKLLHSVPLFASLTDKQLEDILQGPENGIDEFQHHEAIVREFEIANCMYIVLKGILEITIRGAPPVREIAIGKLRPGDFFGEQALLPGSTGKRNANVRSIRASSVFRIDKKYVFLATSPSKKVTNLNDASTISKSSKTNEIHNFIAGIPFFKNVNKSEFDKINSWTEIVTFDAREFIIKKFDQGEYLYIILDGAAEVFNVDELGEFIVLANLGKGQIFGEQALMPSSTGKSNAFVRTTEKSKIVRIPKRHFKAILSRNNQVATKLKTIMNQ